MSGQLRNISFVEILPKKKFFHWTKKGKGRKRVGVRIPHPQISSFRGLLSLSNVIVGVKS